MQFHGIALYLETIHVPLLIVYPGHVPGGLRLATPVSNAAIAATIIDFVQPGQKTFPIGGLDPMWTKPDAKNDWPNPISELAKNDIVIESDGQARDLEPTSLDGDMGSVITSRWHFIHHQNRENQLYDWVNDPGELKNLIDTAEGRTVAEELKLELAKRNR